MDLGAANLHTWRIEANQGKKAGPRRHNKNGPSAKPAAGPPGPSTSHAHTTTPRPGSQPTDAAPLAAKARAGGDGPGGVLRGLGLRRLRRSEAEAWGDAAYEGIEVPAKGTDGNFFSSSSSSSGATSNARSTAGRALSHKPEPRKGDCQPPWA